MWSVVVWFYIIQCKPWPTTEQGEHKKKIEKRNKKEKRKTKKTFTKPIDIDLLSSTGDIPVTNKYNKCINSVI